MSIGFGFSVGDFLAALNLVGTVIESLRSTSSASEQYRALISELYTLEDALLRVKRVDLDESQSAERVALQQAAAQCQRTIDGFMKKTEKYQAHLRTGGSGNTARDSWMKIKWATCKREDVGEFKAELRGHRGAIEVLLLTVQMNRNSIHVRAQDKQHRTLAGKIQDISHQWMGKLTVISDSVASCLEQGKQLLESTTQVLRTNIQIFQMICDIQHIITQIPGQVERQQPVFMIDALGKASPFHLEFVRSAEALTAILKVNFEHTGVGPRKIERGEFVIQESGARHEIDLTKPWDMCFFPGQKVAMSMVFKSNFRAFTNYCPRCDTEVQGGMDEETECEACGMTFCRVKDVSTAMEPPMLPSHHQERFKSYLAQNVAHQRPVPQQRVGKRKRDDGIDDEILNFRRVRIKGSTKPKNRCKLYELRKNDWYDRGIGSSHVRYVNGVPWLEVEPEDPLESESEILFMEEITKNVGFQRQQGTLIVWTSLNGVDIALSFETEEGRTTLWEFIKSIPEVSISVYDAPSKATPTPTIATPGAQNSPYGTPEQSLDVSGKELRASQSGS